MTTLVNQIIAELTAEWTPGNTSSKTPTFINLKDEDREFAARGTVSGEGEAEVSAEGEVVGVQTEDNTEVPADLAGSNHIITTPFTITADSDTESIRDQYLVEIKRIIRAKTISGGHWEIGSKFNDDNIRDASGILKGSEMRFE